MIKDIIDGKEVVVSDELLIKYTLKALIGLMQTNLNLTENDKLRINYCINLKKKETFDYLDKFFKEI